MKNVRRPSTWLLAGMTPVVVAVALVLGGCGVGENREDTTMDVETPGGQASPLPTSQPTGPLVTPPTGPPTRPSDTYSRVRVIGTVTATTPDCVEVMDDLGVQWALVGVSDPPAIGARVVARGQPLPETRGGCIGAPVMTHDLDVVDEAQ